MTPASPLGGCQAAALRFIAHKFCYRPGFLKAKAACAAFGCTPYVALVIDAAERIRVFLLSLRHLQKLFPGGRKVSAWQMSDSFLRKYYADPEINIFEFSAHSQKWF